MTQSHLLRGWGLGLALMNFGARATAQRAVPATQVVYTVEIADTTSRLIHVTATFSGLAQRALDLSLPVWTPGWYTIENYGKNISHFTALGADGKPRSHPLIRRQTWRVDVAGQSRVTVSFDYRADVLALNQAKLTSAFGFFTGTQLFLLAEGRRALPATVHFSLPAGWQIATALDETVDPATFTAPNYEVLVDAPTMVGNFDVTRFDAVGKPHYFVAEPAGTFTADKTARMTALLSRVARADSALFRGVPYRKYLYFYHFAPAESHAGGALEHSTSHVMMAGPGAAAEPERLIRVASHEYFHLWNVKRIRPAEMWPYDYARENETPLLWLAEGFTNYYGDAALQRTGIWSAAERVAAIARAIGVVESNEARRSMSPADASLATWLCYDTPCASAVSYYPWGELLAALLDLSVRHDSRGRASLDDVMRALYHEHYERGRGFTTDDVIRILTRLTARDYRPFFARHVSGTEVPAYDSILGYAGYRLQGRMRTVGVLGVGLEPADFTIVEVPAPTPAQRALRDSWLKTN
ncbi:MAG: PDZ domain-containing protein [Gemmatimonadaceae bacterium]